MANYFGAGGTSGTAIPFNPANNNNHLLQRTHNIDTLVIHSTDSPPSRTWDKYQEVTVTGMKTYPNYAVGRDPGEIVQFVPESTVAQHAGMKNYFQGAENVNPRS